ncbi:MAG: hypothetical protein AB8I08_05640 [Sandaracinaceae bacterium]
MSCRAPQPVAPSPVRGPTPTETTSTEAAPIVRDRQADGGLSIAIAPGGGYTFAYMPLDAREGSVASIGHLGWLGGALDLHYGFGDHVYFGFSVEAARIVNSDDSQGTSSRIALGPSLLLRPVRPFYVGIDALIQYQSFDDVDATFDGYPNEPSVIQDMDANVSVGVAFRLRLGFVIRVTDLFAIVPEARFSTTPIGLVLEDADASTSLVGSLEAQGTSLVTASAGMFLGARFFF